MKSSRRGEFGWLVASCVGLLALFILLGQSRPDRVVGIYPVLFCIAAVGWELHFKRRRWPVAKVLIPALPTLAFLAMAPGILPLLPPARAAAYAEGLGIVPKIEKVGESSTLPQWLADRLGWESLARRVADVAHGLSEPDRPAAIIGGNYGFAGALAHYRKTYDLPPVFSFHNNYHSWGPPPAKTETFILVGISVEEAARFFDEVRTVESRVCELCVGDRRKPAITLARAPKQPVASVWPALRLLM
jgi:hypothetical protein